MRKLHFAVLFTLLAGLAPMLPPASSAQLVVGVSVRVGPPPLRVVAVQPICPGPGYLWTPGYWAYGPAGYYWVDGAWVEPPEVGLLWTPGYWGWEGGYYHWHRGYWGPHVGFYGGINYGFGYFGAGFVGGHWDHDRFFYNSAVWHVNERVVRNVYVDRTYVRDVHEDRASYNGGRGGVDRRPSREEMSYDHERHFGATPAQARHEEGFRGGERGGNGYHSFQPPNHNEHRDMARSNDRGGHGNGGEMRANDRGGHGNGGESRPYNGGNHAEHMSNASHGQGGTKGNEGKQEKGPRHEGKPDHQRR
jgi:hypothetical protein